MAAREGGGKGGVKGYEAMAANKIGGFVGSVPAGAPIMAADFIIVKGVYRRYFTLSAGKMV